MADQVAESWLLDKRWRGGRVIDRAGPSVALSWIGAFLFGGFSVAIVSAVIKQPPLRHDFPVIIAAIFPLVTVMLLVKALRKTARWLRFGRSVFEMVTFPGVVGAQLVGMVITKVKLQAHEGFDVRLACVNRVWTKVGTDNSCTDNVLWDEEQHLVRGAAADDPTHSTIPVGFRIPRDCRPTDATDVNNQIFWKLTVRAKVPGVSYEANFEVPVFVTAESDAVEVSAEVDPVAPYRAAARERTGPTERGIRYWQDAPGTVHIQFRAGRNLRMSLLMFCFAAAATTATYFLWQQPKNDLFSRFVLETMIGGFGFVSLVLLTCSFVMLFQNKKVVADAREVVVTTRYLFVLKTTQRIDSKEVQDVRIKRNMSSGDKEWFEIDLIMTGEKIACVGSGIEKEDATWLVQRLTEAILGKQNRTPLVV